MLNVGACPRLRYITAAKKKFWFFWFWMLKNRSKLNKTCLVWKVLSLVRVILTRNTIFWFGWIFELKSDQTGLWIPLSMTTQAKSQIIVINLMSFFYHIITFYTKLWILIRIFIYLNYMTSFYIFLNLVLIYFYISKNFLKIIFLFFWFEIDFFVYLDFFDVKIKF